MAILDGLNIQKPGDREPLSRLPGYIRETRRTIQRLKVLHVQFEVGTERGDLVYPDQFSGVWMRSMAQITGKDYFFGIAVPEEGAVIIGPLAILDEWGWEPNSTLYLSKDRPGKMTYEDTGVMAGYTISRQAVMLLILEQTQRKILYDAILKLELAVEKNNQLYEENKGRWEDVKRWTIRNEEILVEIERLFSGVTDATVKIEKWMKELYEKYYEIADWLNEIKQIACIVKNYAEQVLDVAASLDFDACALQTLFTRLSELEKIAYSIGVDPCESPLESLYADWGRITETVERWDYYGKLTEPVRFEDDWGSLEPINPDDDNGMSCCPSKPQLPENIFVYENWGVLYRTPGCEDDWGSIAVTPEAHDDYGFLICYKTT